MGRRLIISRPWRVEKRGRPRLPRESKEKFARGNTSEFDTLVCKIIEQFRLSHVSQKFPKAHWEEYGIIKEELPNLQLRRLWKRLETEFYFEDLLKFEIQWKKYKTLNS
ncbi:hypothetical protein JWG45_17520 [Leptospira sp. 201903070]|uniref:Uncharacterized protein n=1 Tax=Leptospira ainlahdjerensis TaxID=2810033 RepID=A0ABS2UHC8_9LEPT|nr:hypothetical protein [Leptospira ainlahdjerensis]MBM9578948.1 hypothetical protein [Leptospira ainlahdjerensis]